MQAATRRVIGRQCRDYSIGCNFDHARAEEVVYSEHGAGAVDRQTV